jgi:hypothetical protein
MAYALRSGAEVLVAVCVLVRAWTSKRCSISDVAHVSAMDVGALRLHDSGDLPHAKDRDSRSRHRYVLPHDLKVALPDSVEPKR